MTELIINGDSITDKKQLHTLISTTLSFPDWYGNNLDAMFDCLTDLKDEAVVIFENFRALRDNLGRYADSTKRVFLNAAKENPKLTVKTKQ